MAALSWQAKVRQSKRTKGMAQRYFFILLSFVVRMECDFFASFDIERA